MRRIYLILLSVALACGITSCKEDSGPDPRPAGPDYFIAKTASKDFTVAQVKQMVAAVSPDLARMLDEVEFPTGTMRVDAITYHTIDPQGEPVVASGIVSYPLDLEIGRVVVGQHGTILSNFEAPSSVLFQPESVLSLLGYAVVMPDYIGFGASKDLTHPYLHVESTGRTAVDMLFAAREYMKTLETPIDGEVTVIGYSQGGHAALAFEKVAEEQYAKEIQIKTVFAGGGPYDLPSTYDEFAKTDYTSYPCSIPYTVIGLNYGDNLKLDFSKVFIEPLLSQYDKWYNSKNYTSTQINSALGTMISGFMHPDIFTFTQEFKPEINKVFTSLAKNSLLDWKPKAVVSLFHARNDSVVPLFNSEKAYASFLQKGASGVTLTYSDGDHADGMVDFYIHVFNELK